MARRAAKPWGDWRENVRELAIVVIGVLIALGAQQLVESLHQHQVAADTRKAVNDEIAGNLGIVEVRAGAEACVARRLAELREIIDGWGRTGSFKTPRLVSTSPGIRVFVPRYEAAVSSGRVAQLSREEQYRFGTLANAFRLYDQVQEREGYAWARLRMLQSGPEALSAGDRTVIREALQEASFLDYGVRIAGKQIITRAKRYGFKASSDQYRDFAPQIWKGGRFTPSICLSIDTLPEETKKILVTPLPQ
jgi:hypothetical protein